MIQVPIFKSTKVDDLLCKTTFKKNEKGNFSLVNSKTPLFHAIKYVDNFSSKLVALEGINNSTPTVLNCQKGTNILLQNGSKIFKGNMNFISIFNSSDDFTREKLPGNLINNSFYFIVESPSKNEIANIISIPKLEKNIFMSFIFNYHFSQKENIYRAQKELKLETSLFNPIINYDKKNKYLIFKSSKKGEGNKLKIEIKNPKLIKEIEKINIFYSFQLEWCKSFLMLKY